MLKLAYIQATSIDCLPISQNYKHEAGHRSYCFLNPLTAGLKMLFDIPVCRDKFPFFAVGSVIGALRLYFLRYLLYFLYVFLYFLGYDMISIYFDYVDNYILKICNNCVFLYKKKCFFEPLYNFNHIKPHMILVNLQFLLTEYMYKHLILV